MDHVERDMECFPPVPCEKSDTHHFSKQESSRNKN